MVSPDHQGTRHARIQDSDQIGTAAEKGARARNEAPKGHRADIPKLKRKLGEFAPLFLGGTNFYLLVLGSMADLKGPSQEGSKIGIGLG